MNKSVCDACGGSNIYTVYTLPRIPAFQNKLFVTPEAAQSAPPARVELTACSDCGFVFNAAFDNTLMDYDGDYQNAQDHSPTFQGYLDEVAGIIMAAVDKTDTVVEIGCGKGYFLEVLKSKGLCVKGFDPTYEGSSPDIVKAYFGPETAVDMVADIVVMRHTLEHIPSPYAFLHELKSILKPMCRIFIEIPRVEWIAEHRAFWDIFHEHCNYFSEDFFRKIFSGNCKITSVFSDQYMMVSAQIGDLVDKIPASPQPDYRDMFSAEITKHRAAVEAGGKHYVWGAGAKGIAFANILDPEKKYIPALVDINPRKQGHYISLTGHPCVAPEDIDWQNLTSTDCLWIMNQRYKNEILAALPQSLVCRIITLGED